MRYPKGINWHRHRAEVPYLSDEVIRMRRDSAVRRAQEEEAKAIDAYARREGPSEPYYGPNGWRQIAKLRARSARIARMYAAFYVTVIQYRTAREVALAR